MVRLAAPRIEIRVLEKPVNALMDQVAWMSQYWQELAAREDPRGFHHELGMETRLLAALDADIARRAGFARCGLAAMKSALVRPHSFYGGDTLILSEPLAAGMRSTLSTVYDFVVKR